MPPKTIRTYIPASRASLYICACTIILLCGAAYFTSLSNGFVYDDIPQVVNNPWIRDVKHIPAIFTSNVWGFAGIATNYYRPFMLVDYLITYRVFGLEPWGFHLVNICYLAAVSLLVFSITFNLLRRALPAGVTPDLAQPLVAALLFASHPVHTEAVAWVGGIPDLSFTFFCLLSLFFFIRSDRQYPPARGDVLFSAASFFIATLCKEPAVTFPAILAAYDYAYNSRKYVLRDYVKRYAPFLIATGVYFMLRITALGAFSPVTRHEGLTLLQTVLNAFHFFAVYLGKLLLPVNLNAWHMFDPLISPAEPRSVSAIAVSLVFAAAIVTTARKNRFVFFALVLILVPLLPALYIPGLGENPFAERYLFLPSVGFIMIAASLLFHVATLHAGLAAAIFLVIIMCYTAGTTYRNLVWKDDYTFWSDTVKKSPEGPIPHYNLGTALAQRGRFDEAIAQYRIAIALKPAAVAYKSLGAAYKSNGLIDKAIEEYLRAMRMEPDDASTHNELGSWYAETGALDKAIEHFGNAVALHPAFADAHFNLGLACREKGLVEKAMEHFEIAAHLKPGEPAFSAMLDRIKDEYLRLNK